MNPIPSPYVESVEGLKERVVKYLEHLKVPHPKSGKHMCSKECHLIERNYVLALVKSFLK